MIGTLSKVLSTTSSSSTASTPPGSPLPPRRSTFHTLASRLSDSKKEFLEQLPHHQQQLSRLKKRAKSLLSSSVIDQLAFDRRNTSTGVRRARRAPSVRNDASFFLATATRRRTASRKHRIIRLDHQCRRNLPTHQRCTCNSRAQVRHGHTATETPAAIHTHRRRTVQAGRPTGPERRSSQLRVLVDHARVARTCARPQLADGLQHRNEWIQSEPTLPALDGGRPGRTGVTHCQRYRTEREQCSSTARRCIGVVSLRRLSARTSLNS